MVPIRKNLVPSTKYSIKCPYTMVPTRIVVHNTANDASAANEIAYMIRNDNEVSFHYAVDDIEIVQGIPEDRNAWHASDGGSGKGNREGIGIEICYSKGGGSKFTKAEKNAAEFVAYLLKQYGWGIDKVTKHQDYSGKYCPHRTLDKGWDRFLKLVQEYLNPTTKKEMYRVRKSWLNVASQKGAFSVFENAVDCCKKAGAGYKVFDSKGVVKYEYVVPAPAPAPAPKPTPKPVVKDTSLRSGSKGDKVKTLQTNLNMLGYNCGAADGNFGAKTLAAVKAFQKDQKLVVDGIVGAGTQAAIDKAIKAASKKITVTYRVWDDVKNAWLPVVHDNTDYAGIFGHDVCAVYIDLSYGDVWYQVHTKGGKWLGEVKNLEDYAGIFNKPIDGIRIKTNTGKKVHYRVHLRKQKRWLGWVTGYNTNDAKNGYAGILGQEIDAIQVYVK